MLSKTFMEDLALYLAIAALLLSVIVVFATLGNTKKLKNPAVFPKGFKVNHDINPSKKEK